MIRNVQRNKLSKVKRLVAVLFSLAMCVIAFYPLKSNAADYPNKAKFYYDDTFSCVSNLNDKQPAYCADLVLTPDMHGKYEYKKVESNHTLDYVLYHGADGPEFLQHHTIFGVAVDDPVTAHGITQIAVWATQGIKTGNGLDEDCNYFITDDNSEYKPKHGKPNFSYTRLSPEHQKLCKLIIKNAMEYEKKGPSEKDPEYKCSRLYKCNDSSYQRFVTYYSLGNLKINKVSALPDITDNNDLYNLENTYFHIYQGVTWDDAIYTGKWMKATTQLNNNGDVVAKCVDVDNPNNDFISLKNGAYWLVEEEYEGHTNTGYIKDSEPIKVYIFPKQTTYASNNESECIENTPKYVNIETLVEKYAADNDSSSESTPLENVKFEVKYYDVFTKYVNDCFEIPSCKPIRSWILKSDKNGMVKLDNEHKLGGDAFYKDKNDKPCIPRGTITIQEIEAPSEYKVDDTIHVVQTDQVKNKPIGLLPIKLTNSSKRSDLSFTKIDASTQNTVANIPFKITCIDTGESHILVTDENGCINTASSNVPHSHNTNINDDYVENDLVTNENKLTSNSGVWFTTGSGKNTKVNDYVGALPYGKYRIEELRCKNNVNKNCQPFKIVVEEDKKNYCLNNIENNPIEFNTTLSDKKDSKYVFAVDKSILKDKIYLSNLSPNTKYKLVGTLHLIDNDKDLGVIKNDLDKPIKVIKEFQTSTDTTVDATLEYNIDVSKYKGKQIVSCVELFNNNCLVATHNDITDTNQTVSIPTISTLATNSHNEKNVEVTNKTKIIDKVTYSGLIKNKTYSLVGKIYDTNDTTKPIKTFNNAFIAKASNGQATNTTVLDTTDLIGKDLVLTEELYFKEELIAKHEDFSDTKQMLHVPKISTVARTDAETNCFDRLTTKTIVDTIRYENLIPNKKYKIVASLNNVDIKKTQTAAELDDNYETESLNQDEPNDEQILNTGTKQTATHEEQEECNDELEVKKIQSTEIEFTPEDTSGEVDVEFEVNENNFTNKIVVFDKLYLNDTLLITHDNIEDTDQTVYVPDILTKLSSTDGSKEITPCKSTQLIDVVEISNLPINTKYIAEGKLVILDKNSNEIKLPKLIEKKMTASAPVVFEDTKATAELNYKINTVKIPNHKIVSTVEIKLDDKTCATHYNLEDKNQTVKVIQNKKIPKTFDFFTNHLLLKVATLVIAAYIIFKVKGFHTSNKPQRGIY